jgi:hypothetical protein
MKRRGGFSIPLVLLFCTISVMFLLVFVNARVSGSGQNKMAFAKLQAHYIAQAAVQHALLKVRILPNESYNAGLLLIGACPFIPVNTAFSGGGTPQTAFHEMFIGDVNSTRYPIPGSEFSGWSYTASDIKPLMAQTTGDNQRVHAVEIHGAGIAHVKVKGVQLDVADEVIRTVKVARKN